MPKVSDEHKKQVREQLLDAAQACLLERGMEGLTTRDVLERADLSSGTMYHYFSGKDDLVMALAERIASIDLGNLGTIDDLLSMLRQLLPDVSGEPSVLPELRARARIDDRVRRSLRRFDEMVISRFSPIVEAARHNGTLPADTDPEALVELVELMIEALDSHSSADMFVTSRSRVANSFIAVLSSYQEPGVSPS